MTHPASKTYEALSAFVFECSLVAIVGMTKNASFIDQESVICGFQGLIQKIMQNRSESANK